MPTQPSQSFANSSLEPVPAGLRTSRVAPRILASLMLLISVLGFVRLYPALQGEEQNVASFLDGELRGGTRHVRLLTSGDKTSERALLGELAITIDHEEDYNLTINGSLGAEGKTSLSVQALFSQYRYLQKLTLRVIEPGAALEFLWDFNGDRIGHLQISDSQGSRSRELAIPAPILLRDIGEDDYSIVAPLILQRALEDPERQLMFAPLNENESTTFSDATAPSLVQIIEKRLEGIPTAAQKQ